VRERVFVHDFVHVPELVLQVVELRVRELHGQRDLLAVLQAGVGAEVGARAVHGQPAVVRRGKLPRGLKGKGGGKRGRENRVTRNRQGQRQGERENNENEECPSAAIRSRCASQTTAAALPVCHQSLRSAAFCPLCCHCSPRSNFCAAARSAIALLGARFTLSMVR